MRSSELNQFIAGQLVRPHELVKNRFGQYSTTSLGTQLTLQDTNAVFT